MDFFQVSRKCLGWVGHNFQNPSMGWSKTIHWSMCFTTLSLNIFMLHSTVDNITKNLQLATAGLSIILTNSLTSGKMALFLYRKKLFTSQMEELEKLVKSCGKNERLVNANKMTLKFERKYRILCMMTGFYFMLMPFFKMAWQKYNGENIVADVPYPALFPFDIQNVPGYAFTYFHSGIATWVVVFYVPAMDSLFYSFSIILSTQFQILQDKIEANDFDDSENELRHQIHGYIKYQNVLFSHCDRMRILFKPIMIIQFLLTSLQVCLIVFQLVTYADDLAILIPNITFLCVLLLQPFIYCYGGEIIMHESLQINWSLQTSKWYKLSPKLRRTISLMILRSQRPVIIEAGFYKATLEMFMSIVQTAASYIALLRSLD